MPRLYLLAILLLSHCAHEPRISPFCTDGCTLIPEQSPSGGHNWRECCVEHDFAYWKGGSAAERLAADQKLRDCMLRKSGSERFSKLVFSTVRCTGQAHYPTWFRWGYGWNYRRPESPLTPEEHIMIALALLDSSDAPHPCSGCRSRVPTPPHRR